MKTLRGVAKVLCLYHWDEGYDPAIDDMINEFIRMGWISGFLAGAQWREENPVTPGSVPDPESDPIELCGLLWDRDNLAVGGYEKDGHHYYVWQDAMYAAKSVGKRLPTREKWEALCDLGSTWDDERKGRQPAEQQQSRQWLQRALRAGQMTASPSNCQIIIDNRTFKKH